MIILTFSQKDCHAQVYIYFHAVSMQGVSRLVHHGQCTVFLKDANLASRSVVRIFLLRIKTPSAFCWRASSLFEREVVAVSRYAPGTRVGVYWPPTADVAFLESVVRYHATFTFTGLRSSVDCDDSLDGRTALN